MKLKFNSALTLIDLSFIHKTMETRAKFNINNEINKLNKLMNNKRIKSFKNFQRDFILKVPKLKIRYLLHVLFLTRENPKIEIYLKQLLENFSIAELNNLDGKGYTILHYIINDHTNISLNSYEIIINFGISVNSITKCNNTPLHYMDTESSENVQNIISLFVKYGADLNILNDEDMSVLDGIMKYVLNKDSEIIIMTLIDFGAKLNNPLLFEDNSSQKFVDSYNLRNIKPAIKNEIKI